MAPVLAFWCAALVVALLAFPIAQRLFRRFPDAGAGLALPLGLILASYAYFLLRSADVLPAGRGGFLLAIVMLAGAGLAVARFDPRFGSTVRRSGSGMLASAGLFTTLFFGYAAFRSYAPAIGGTEQPMDLLFLNAMLESAEYPPEDPWLAGNSVSYYYFGYLQTAMLTAISGVESSIGYNLGLAAVFASAASAVASVCAALARWVISRSQAWVVGTAALGVGFLLFAGSLIGVFEFAAAHERYNDGLYEAFGVASLLPCERTDAEACYAGTTGPRTQSWYPDQFWFWWGASRVIPGTITEFPAFSFILGDLHPHVTALPGVLLAVGFALALWRARAPLTFATLRRSPFLTVVTAIIFGALAFQNTWDVLAFSAVLGVAAIARNARGMPLAFAARNALFYLVPVGVLAIVLYAPWWPTFSSQAGGLYAYVGEGTHPNHAFLQFGALGLAALLATVWALRRMSAGFLSGHAVYAAWLPVIPLLSWALLAAVRGDWSTAVQQRGAGGWVTLTILASATWVLATAALALHNRRSPGAPVAALGAVGILLIYGAELFFIRDVFFGGIPRLNTVFKLTYQAWVLLAIAGAVGLAAVAADAVRRDLAARIAVVPVAVIAVFAFIYIVGAIPNRANGFENESNIDGLSVLARNDPDEYALTRWIATNVERGDVIIEATGRQWLAGEDGPELQPGGVSYTDAGRIASRTGRPTAIGWYSHEIQWRGDSAANHETFGERQAAVDSIYLSASPEEALARLDELGARYVVDGRLEQSRYPGEHRSDLGAFLDLAFESGDLRVYRVPAQREVPTS